LKIMVFVRVPVPQSRPVPIAIWALTAFALLSVCPVLAQSQSAFATLHGSVRDQYGHAVAAATVAVHTRTGGLIQRVKTDRDGSYSFLGLEAGTYTLSALVADQGEAEFGPFDITARETKEVDLTLHPPRTVEQKNSSTSAVEFYDEPQFTMAGITEASNPGGHGSDPALRTSEALVKETVALNGEVPGKIPAGPSGAETEKSLLAAVLRDPEDFTANERFGRWLSHERRPKEAISYLEKAASLNPSDYSSAYELASAYAGAGDYQQAQTRAKALIARQDKSELHHLLGSVEEKLGNPLAAVREYQRAAEAEPSETNLFDWGAELLLHRALEPAIEIFTRGNRLYPRSLRLLTGLGVAWYARGSFEQATQFLCQASDLDPHDSQPYLFLGKMTDAGSRPSPAVVERLARFLRFQPDNALANYYYALSIWNRQNSRDVSSAPVEALLQKAVHLDPHLAIAYLRLGILYSDREDFAKALTALQKAVAASPGLEEAHYRLAQTYRQVGERAQAQQELQLYDQLSKNAKQQAETERREIQEFVYSSSEQTVASPHSRD
jgi:tetratricopeptide (TPR) repeat protein